MEMKNETPQKEKYEAPKAIVECIKLEQDFLQQVDASNTLPGGGGVNEL